MKKKFETLPLIMLLASVAVTVISVAARSVLTLTALDANYGVYEHGNILPIIYHALLALALIAIALLPFIKSPKRDPEYVRPHSNLTVFASCVCAFMLLASAGVIVYYMVRNGASPDIFDTLELCFTPLAIIYFVGLVLSDTKPSAPLALMTMFVIAWCTVCLIRTYFDNSVLQVSPNKILSELAMLSAMIYFLSEARAQLGIIKHKLYLASAIVTPVLLMTAAVPNLLFAKSLSIGTSDSTLRYAVCAALAIFIWARLFAYTKKETVKYITE